LSIAKRLGGFYAANISTKSDIDTFPANYFSTTAYSNAITVPTIVRVITAQTNCSVTSLTTNIAIDFSLFFDANNFEEYATRFTLFRYWRLRSRRPLGGLG
jgi:hypothetical protein